MLMKNFSKCNLKIVTNLNPMAFEFPCGGELILSAMPSMEPPTGDISPTEAQLLSSPVKSEAVESTR